MEPEQFEEIMRSVLAESAPADTRVVVPIASFPAQDEDGVQVDVVGVTFLQSDDRDLDFVIIVEADGGEMFPSIRQSVWRRETA